MNIHKEHIHKIDYPSCLESRVTSHMGAPHFLIGPPFPYCIEITEWLTNSPTTEIFRLQQPPRHLQSPKDEIYKPAKMPQEISDIKNVSLLFLIREVENWMERC